MVSLSSTLILPLTDERPLGKSTIASQVSTGLCPMKRYSPLPPFSQSFDMAIRRGREEAGVPRTGVIFE